MDEKYFVEASDGNRYGPVDFATLKAWVAEGRVNRSVAIVGETSGERRLAGEIPGLFEDAAVAPPPVAPPVGGAAGYAPPAELPPSKGPNWALIIGIPVALCGCGGVILAAILLPVFAQARLAAQRTMGMSNLKQLGTGIFMYAGDADDHFPPSMASAAELQPYLEPYTKQPSLFAPIKETGGVILGDARMSLRSMTNVQSPADTIMLYESAARQGGKTPVGFADGSARLIPFGTIASRMEPDPFGGITLEEERAQERGGASETPTMPEPPAAPEGTTPEGNPSEGTIPEGSGSEGTGGGGTF